MRPYSKRGILQDNDKLPNLARNESENGCQIFLIRKQNKVTSTVFVLQIIFYEHKRPLQYFCLLMAICATKPLDLKNIAHRTCNLWSFTILVSHFFIPRLFRVGKDVAKFRSL